MSRYLANEVEAAQPWKQLLGRWHLVEDRSEDAPDEKIWCNKCPLFTAFVAQSIDGFEFELTNPDGQHLLKQDMRAQTIGEAWLEADRILAEFLTLGAMILGEQTAPGEVRFKQVSHSPDGKLYGLGMDGILYVQTYPPSKGGYPAWSPVRMKALVGEVDG